MRGRCVVWGGIGDPPFFWQFVKDAHGIDDCLKRVVSLASPAPSTRSSPFSLAAFPAAFSIACGRPNHERSSSPFLTVLPLLITRDQKEGDGEKNERTGPLEWVGTPGVCFCYSLFFSSAIKVSSTSSVYGMRISLMPLSLHHCSFIPSLRSTSSNFAFISSSVIAPVKFTGMKCC